MYDWLLKIPGTNKILQYFMYLGEKYLPEAVEIAKNPRKMIAVASVATGAYIIYRLTDRVQILESKTTSNSNAIHINEHKIQMATSSLNQPSNNQAFDALKNQLILANKRTDGLESELKETKADQARLERELAGFQLFQARTQDIQDNTANPNRTVQRSRSMPNIHLAETLETAQPEESEVETKESKREKKSK